LVCDTVAAAQTAEVENAWFWARNTYTTAFYLDRGSARKGLFSQLEVESFCCAGRVLEKAIAADGTRIRVNRPDKAWIIPEQLKT
jgi:hypothetical protein